MLRIEPGEPCGWTRAAVAVGNLDGVHRGHQALASRAVEDARRSGALSVALTFDPPLFDRGREPLDMARQRLNACDRVLLLLLNP